MLGDCMSRILGELFDLGEPMSFMDLGEPMFLYGDVPFIMFRSYGFALMFGESIFSPGESGIFMFGESFTRTIGESFTFIEGDPNDFTFDFPVGLPNRLMSLGNVATGSSYPANGDCGFLADFFVPPNMPVM